MQREKKLEYGETKQKGAGHVAQAYACFGADECQLMKSTEVRARFPELAASGGADVAPRCPAPQRPLSPPRAAARARRRGQ